MPLKKPKKGGMSKLVDRLKKLDREEVGKETLQTLEKAGIIKKKSKKIN